MAQQTQPGPSGTPQRLYGTFGVSSFAPNVVGYRFYDVGTEAGATALFAQNTRAEHAWSNSQLDAQLRLLVQNDGTLGGASTDDWQLQYSTTLSGQDTWVNVEGGIGTYGHTDCHPNISDVADGGAATSRLTGGTGSFIAGEVEESDAEIEDFQLTGSNHTEFCFGLRFHDTLGAALTTPMLGEESLYFRLLYNGSTAGITNSVTPEVLCINANLNQHAFQFYNDDGSESTATALAAENVNVNIDSAAAPTFHLRIGLDNTNSRAAPSTNHFSLYYSKNSGAWTKVTAATTNVQAYPSSGLTDGGNTTQRLSNGAGSGGFEAGKQDEGDGTAGNFATSADKYHESVWACTLVDGDLANNDTIDFKVYRGYGANNLPNLTYTEIPRITVTT